MSRISGLAGAGPLAGDRSPSLVQRFGVAVAQVWAHLAASRRKQEAIAELERLDDRMLQDIGITRTEIPMIVRESSRYNLK